MIFLWKEKDESLANNNLPLLCLVVEKLLHCIEQSSHLIVFSRDVITWLETLELSRFSKVTLKKLNLNLTSYGQFLSTNKTHFIITNELTSTKIGVFEGKRYISLYAFYQYPQILESPVLLVENSNFDGYFYSSILSQLAFRLTSETLQFSIYNAGGCGNFADCAEYLLIKKLFTILIHDNDNIGRDSAGCKSYNCTIEKIKEKKIEAVDLFFTHTLLTSREIENLFPLEIYNGIRPNDKTVSYLSQVSIVDKSVMDYYHIIDLKNGLKKTKELHSEFDDKFTSFLPGRPKTKTLTGFGDDMLSIVKRTVDIEEITDKIIDCPVILQKWQQLLNIVTPIAIAYQKKYYQVI